ncbi:MAG: G5 domain-containing protein [Anaerolineae bacterium]|nr:G5 domain-containing protein [Anaerolineae bacterium]
MKPAESTIHALTYKTRRINLLLREIFRSGGLCILLLMVLYGCGGQPLTQSELNIQLIMDGREAVVQSKSQTVSDLLQEQSIVLSEFDRVTPPETTRLYDQMTVKITRVLYDVEVITETVPFERKIVRDATIPEGQSRLIQSGSAGMREIKYRLTLEDGIQVERILLSDTFTASPKDEITVVGTRTELVTVSITGTLAYLNRQDGWIIGDNNQERRRLTSTGDLDGRIFELSPDGGLLMYSRSVSKTATFNELWIVRTTEASPNAIPLDVKNVLWAGWSPTTSEIAWTTAQPSDRPPGWRGENDLWTASLNSRNLLVNRKEIQEPEIGTGYGWWGTRYVWSPDGEKIAFSLPQSIGFLDRETQRKTILHTFAAYKTYNSWAWNPGLTWTSDGQFIFSVVHAEAPGGGDEEESPVFDIKAIDASGIFSVEIASETGMWSAPTLSPGGTTLLYGRAIIPYQSASSRYRLCHIDLDGSNQQCFYPPTDDDLGIEIPLWLWSPSGDSVAFIMNGDLMMVSLYNSHATALTDEGQITKFDWK